jgi:hypothetical protein
MRKFIPEILLEIDNNVENLEVYKNYAPLKTLFEYAFIPEKKFDLPEGAPPFRKDAAPIGMTSSPFVSEFRRFYIFEKSKQLPRIKKEAIFIQMLESIHPSEAEILIAVKDQNINKLYPSIKRGVLEQYGFIPKLGNENEGKAEGGSLAKKS